MHLTEAQIVRAFLAWRPALTAAAWTVVRDAHTAEDIFQNVTLKALTGSAVFESEPALRSWAFISVRREGIDWLRRTRREVPGIEADVLDRLEQEWQREDGRTASPRIDALRECLQALPEASRRLLRLRYHDGFNCEEVARDLGVGLDAVYKRLSRLHQALRACMERRQEARVSVLDGGAA